MGAKRRGDSRRDLEAKTHLGALCLVERSHDVDLHWYQNAMSAWDAALRRLETAQFTCAEDALSNLEDILVDILLLRLEVSVFLQAKLALPDLGHLILHLGSDRDLLQTKDAERAPVGGHGADSHGAVRSHSAGTPGSRGDRSEERWCRHYQSERVDEGGRSGERRWVVFVALRLPVQNSSEISAAISEACLRICTTLDI